MAMRVTGMYSGLDTESIIRDLVAVRQGKVDDVKKKQTSLQWKQDAWKSLNTKIFSFYNNTLSSLRLQSSFAKKTTSVSNSSVASVLTSDGAMNSVQSLKVNKLAKSAYMTGGEVKTSSGGKVAANTRLVNMGIQEGSTFELKVGNRAPVEFKVGATTTVSNLLSQMRSAGVNASFDANTQRIFIGATASGSARDFSLTSKTIEGMDALDKLGLMVYDDAKGFYEDIAKMGTPAGAAEYQQAYEKLALSMAQNAEKEYNALDAKITDATTKMADFFTEYANTYAGTYGSDYGSTLADLVSDTSGELQKLKDDIAALKADKELLGSGFTQDQELEDLEGMLDLANKYEAQEKAITGWQAEQVPLADLYAYDSSSEVIATTDAEDDAKAVINAQIAAADAKLLNWASSSTNGAVKLAGQDAEIVLNNATFTSSTNVFEINGLTITANAETGPGEEVILTTQDDVSGIYDMVKDFIKEYNALVNEFDALFNAESSKGYEPLTSEEKEALSEKEIEEWEKKIKDSLLRKDSTLGTVSNAFKEIAAMGFKVNGKTMYLFDFGIDKMNYFDAAANEKNAYLISGDSDFASVKNDENKLMQMITTNPTVVRDFFNQLANELHKKVFSMGSAIDGYSSTFTVYADKKMQKDHDGYNSQIKRLEEMLKSYEDKWYSKFGAMETALARMQSNMSAITGLLGGNGGGGR